MDFLKKDGCCLLVLAVSITYLSTTLMANGAEEFGLDSAGGRFGFSAESRSETFRQAEAFMNWSLPCEWEFTEDWRILWRVDVAAGSLHGHSKDAFVGSVGPTFVLKYDKCPVSFEAGFSPTYISRREFDPADLGSLLQFTSHGQLNWDLGEHFQISYRFQHMSNAGLSGHNPGVNLHMFGIAYRF